MVAREKWIESSVLTIEVECRAAVAIDDDDEHARHDVSDRLSVSQSAGHTPIGVRSPVRALVEVQRRFGGLAPRALVGGQFVLDTGFATVFEVYVGIGPADRSSPECRSRLWKRPFTVGLPVDFAPATLRGFRDHDTLPAGILTLDRAGFDVVESSAVVFAEAAALLRLILACQVYGRDVEREVRALVLTW